jgi:iron complex outermembrane recepter protein
VKNDLSIQPRLATAAARPRHSSPVRVHTCPGARWLLLLFALPSTFAFGAAGDDFTNLTLEELSQIQVTSIARKHGSLFDTSAAAYVLTGDDLHRSGATDLATALRAIPGMQVGQIDPYNYAITTRGFNDSTSSKLLVLMDGRSLYSQTFSGAYWNYHELFFEDIDRLETIRGPGATLWGANAVNGVINIVSKSAFSTQGTLLTASRGDVLDGIAGVRHGWQIGASTAVRVYARHHEENDQASTASTGTGVSGWNSTLAGARLDWKRPGGGGLTMIGEFRDQRIAATSTFPQLLPPYASLHRETRTRRGGHVLGRWRQPIANSGEITAQASYERMVANDLTFGEEHDILDSDVQISLKPLRNHDILAGISARRDSDKLRPTAAVTYANARAATTFLGAFVQDEITVVPRRLSVTAGAKMERNSFTGWELQPGLRALWRPSDHQRIWAAVSRAVRTPSRVERSIDYFVATTPPTPLVPLPTKVVAQGSPSFDSERLTAFELGHRIKILPQLTLDTALFLNRYRDVRGLRGNIVPFVPVPVPHVNYTLQATNNIRGDTYGGEAIARWRTNENLYFEASVSTLRYDLREQNLAPGGLPDISLAGLVGSTPRREYKLRTNWDITDDWTFDAFLRRVDALPEQAIPAYTGLDVHVGWRPRHDLEIEFILRSALDARHAEAPALFLGGSVREIPRSYYVRVTYRR